MIQEHAVEMVEPSHWIFALIPRKSRGGAPRERLTPPSSAGFLFLFSSFTSSPLPRSTNSSVANSSSTDRAFSAAPDRFFPTAKEAKVAERRFVTVYPISRISFGVRPSILCLCVCGGGDEGCPDTERERTIIRIGLGFASFLSAV